MNHQLETRCVHGGSHKYHEDSRAISFPIYQTASFSHTEPGHNGSGFDYTRESNPTREHLEETVASLESAADAVAFTSGMAAISAQAWGAGSMISFRVDSPKTARRVLEKVKLITFAESLGGVESLITYPITQTHPDVPAQVRERLGITDTLLRLSVGLEHVDDIIADLAQAGDSVLLRPPVYYPFYSVIRDNDRQMVENELVYEDAVTRSTLPTLKRRSFSIR